MGHTFPRRAPRESRATGGSLGIVWVERAWGVPSPSGPRASPTRPEGAWESCGYRREPGNRVGRPYVLPSLRFSFRFLPARSIVTCTLSPGLAFDTRSL